MKLHINKLKKLNSKTCQGEIRTEVSTLLDQMAEMHTQNEIKHLKELRDLKEMIKDLKIKNKSLAKSHKHCDSITEPLA